MFSRETSLQIALELPYGTLDIQDDIFKAKYELYHPIIINEKYTGELKTTHYLRDDKEFLREGYKKKNGEYVKYISVGIKNNKFDGEYVRYPDNAFDNLVEGYYIAGKRTGEWKILTSSNKLKTIVHYENDKLNGQAISYGIHEKYKYLANFVDGKPEGHIVISNDKGVVFDLNFKQGKQDGDQVFYYEHGNKDIEMTQVYDNGTYIKTIYPTKYSNVVNKNANYEIATMLKLFNTH